MIATGQYVPFLYPGGTIGAAVVIAYLLIDHRRSRVLERCRYLAFAFVFAFAGYCILYCRARNPAAAFGVGLISAWSILWCAVMLVFNDAQTDFKRIERRERDLDRTSSAQTSPQNGSTTQGNGSALRKRHPTAGQENGTSNTGPGSTQRPAQREGTFTWQTYPSSPFIERMDWVADLFCNFRGMGWNWRIACLPPPPRSVQSQLAANDGTEISDKDTHISRTGMRRYHDTRSLLKSQLWVLVRGYLVLDLLKTLAAHDPYMWGHASDGPPHYLPGPLIQSPVVVKSTRLLVSLAAIFFALQTIFSLGPIFFVGLLGPKILGARGEPWMYPDAYGSFMNVFDKGLAGWWGGWWHQSFRFAFESPATWAVKHLGWDRRSAKAKMLSLTVAFVLSGCLHACGSYTQIGDTRPLMGPFRFFTLQILGVAVQMAVSMGLKRAGVTERLPKVVRQAGNFVYTHVWFYYTAPLLVDDFATGGIWLFEPIPFSLFRSLGFGAPGDRGFCWYGGILRWHSGKHWWDTGMAL